MDLYQVLKQLGTHALARGLPFNAFMIAPIQRVARYPLLLEAIVRHTPEDSPGASAITRAREVRVINSLSSIA